MRMHEETDEVAMSDRLEGEPEGVLLTGRALELFTLMDALFALEETTEEERLLTE